MKIKNWEHAIDLTIERHQVALERNESYDYIKEFYMQVDGWSDACPLCEYLNQQKGVYYYSCDGCLWLVFKGISCSNSFIYNYCNNEKSIKRLNNWKELLPYLDIYPEMFRQEV